MEQAIYDTEDFIIRDGVLLKYDGVEEDVIIPPGVSVIGEEAFKECEFPKTVVIPEGVQIIEDFAFYFCDLKNVILPDSLKVIGARAFAFCNLLEKVELPCNVCEIGPDNFIGCPSLTSFYVQPENKTFFAKNGCLFRKEKGDVILLSCPASFEGTFIVPEDTTVIADYAFFKCGKISCISIPDSVRTLYPSSLYGLSRTCEVHFPRQFAECQTEMFQNSKSFERPAKPKKEPDPDNGVKVLRTAEEILEYDRQFKQEHFALDGMYITIENGKKSVTGCDKNIAGVVKLPDDVVHIAPSAFSYRGGITRVILPEGLRSIGEYAFEGCVNLRNIRIPDSVTDIGHKAFAGCRQLEEIVALNMLDPYPSNIYGPFDDYCRNGQEPSNRRLIYEDKEFTIPVSFPKVRLNSGYVLSWKIALTLGFLAHPELYSAYDLDKKGARYRGASCYEKDLPYAKYAMENKKRLLPYIFENDRPDMLRFYALYGDFSPRVIRESFQEPAKSTGAVKCQAFIDQWLDNSLEIEPIVPKQEALYDLPGNVTSEKALFEWAYEICYCPEPVVRLTEFKSDERDISVEIPEFIDNIPVGFIGQHAFEGYIFYTLEGPLDRSYIKSISCGRKLRRIEGKTIPGVITIKAPAGSFAHKYALKNKCKYEEREG